MTAIVIKTASTAMMIMMIIIGVGSGSSPIGSVGVPVPVEETTEVPVPVPVPVSVPLELGTELEAPVVALLEATLLADETTLLETLATVVVGKDVTTASQRGPPYPKKQVQIPLPSIPSLHVPLTQAGHC